MSARVARRYTFTATHRVPGAAEPWCSSHSHTYTVEVVAAGEVGGSGMVIDTDLLDASWRFVAEQFENKDLNATLGENRTTVELLAADLFEHFAAESDEVERVTVWEDDERWGQAGR